MTVSTWAQRHCMKHGQVTPDEDGDCPLCLDELWARLDAEQKARERMLRAEGLVPCHCGTWAMPGVMHYPSNNPENGPAHKQAEVAP